MAKNIDDMIVPERRKSIRDIPIPEGRRRLDRVARPAASRRASTKKRLADVVEVERQVEREIEREEETVSELQAREPNPDFPRRRRRSRRGVWVGALIAACLLVFATLSLFNGATLAYVPKSATLAFDNDTYTAHKSGTSGLFYSVVKLSRDKGKVAPAGSEQEVERKASGTIVVYNDASTEPQTLVENTRFESPSGKIYRIAKGITIPGKKGTVPGTLEVTVYADQPGESYNSELADFTVPGLKGTPRYTTIYARSKTPMTGGFVGKEKAVNAADLAATKAELQESLKQELWEEVKAEVPEDFILFPSLSSFKFEDLPQTTGSGSGDVTVNLRAHLYGVMFKKADLAAHLAKNKLTLRAGETLDVPALANLNVTFAGTPPADILPLDKIELKVSGNVVAFWNTDEVALKADLLGRHKRDLPSIMENYPTIASSKVTVRPFWKSALPVETEKITVKKVVSE
jgi:hypothetical protein